MPSNSDETATISDPLTGEILEVKVRRAPSDPTSAARPILAPATGEEPTLQLEEKDPAAVSLGRRGGQKGGKARADALTAEQRKESAKKAARARWGKKK